MSLHHLPKTDTAYKILLFFIEIVPISSAACYFIFVYFYFAKGQQLPSDFDPFKFMMTCNFPEGSKSA